MRRSARFCLEWPRWAIGARSLRRGDPGGEVGHVEHEPGQVDAEGLDHAGDDAALDLFQLVLADRVHRLPKAPVVERRGGQVQPPVAGRLGPPVRKSRAWNTGRTPG